MVVQASLAPCLSLWTVTVCPDYQQRRPATLPDFHCNRILLANSGKKKNNTVSHFTNNQTAPRFVSLSGCFIRPCFDPFASSRSSTRSLCLPHFHQEGGAGDEVLQENNLPFLQPTGFDRPRAPNPGRLCVRHLASLNRRCFKLTGWMETALPADTTAPRVWDMARHATFKHMSRTSYTARISCPA